MHNSQGLFRDFLQHSYINGLHLLLFHSPVRHAKTIWLIFLTGIFVWTHIVIVNLTLDYIVQPTEIHMSPDLVHVVNSPFPAVAVCSSNKISRRLLHDYAVKIYQHQQQEASNEERPPVAGATDVDDMERRLLILTDFFLNTPEAPSIPADEATHLHWLLSNYYNTSEYSVRDILRHLSPDCDDIVPRGLIFGQPVNTSQWFLKRPGSSGVCCIFNYNRRSYSKFAFQREADDATMAALPQVIFESNSILNSVQFVLQDASEDDYTFTYHSNTAFQLFLFPREDYPTIQSTTTGEILVEHQTIVEIPIQPEFLQTSRSVQNALPEKRLCYFPHEGKKLLNQSYYSLDECLVRCRINSMQSHCGCVAPLMAGSAIDLIFCTIPDLPCLMKWKRIWYDFDEFPFAHKLDTQTTAGEEESVQQCGHCLPLCNGVNFEISTNVAPLRNTNNNTVNYSHGLLKGMNNFRPLSIIKLYFKLRYAQATQIKMVGDWVVLLNRFGGILSLMYGFSIISYIELVYYLTGKWFVHFYRRIFINGRMDDKSHTISIYWNELQRHR